MQGFESSVQPICVPLRCYCCPVCANTLAHSWRPMADWLLSMFFPCVVLILPQKWAHLQLAVAPWLPLCWQVLPHLWTQGSYPQPHTHLHTHLHTHTLVLSHTDSQEINTQKHSFFSVMLKYHCRQEGLPFLIVACQISLRSLLSGLRGK